MSSDQEKIIYNGVSMIVGWPATIEAAQLITHYIIAEQSYPRVRYGDEQDDWGAERGPCHDCGVIKGQYHVESNCDVERCPLCGGQVITCECDCVPDQNYSS